MAVLDVHGRCALRVAFVFGVTGRRGASRLLFWRFVIIRPRLSRYQTARAAGAARLPSMVMMMMVAVTVATSCSTAGRLTPQADPASAQAVGALAGRTRGRVPTATSGAAVPVVVLRRMLLMWTATDLIVFIVIGGWVILRVGKRVRGRGGALQSRPCVLADRYLLMMVMRRTGSSSHLSISCVSGTTL